jgi:3-oxoacyl-[acyl-carrier-protein] synthase II
MTDKAALVVTGWSVLSPAGIGPDAFAERLAAPVAAASGTNGDELPPSGGFRMPDFSVRDLLGRKGTSALDRVTAMAVVACGRALTDAGVEVGDTNRRGIGVALGTTVGSLKSTSEYSRETFVQDRPYLVNPMLFPNTVMNCAAGRSAIWYGLKGVNATVAGGPLAFFAALRYAANVLARGYADTMLAGGAEELTGHRAWAQHLSGGTAAGEGAAVLVVEREASAHASGRRVDAHVLAAVSGFAPDPAALPGALAGCVRRALTAAGVTAGDVALVVTGADDEILRDVLPDADRICIASAFGECDAAAGALQAAAVLSHHRDERSRDGQVSVLAAYSRRGGVAAAVFRGWSRVGAARR